MSQDLKFVLINNFKCKRCGCTHYDKMIYTGLKTLDEENSIIYEKYVCRNCDFPINLNNYVYTDNITMTSNELLNEATIIDENQINNKGVSNNERCTYSATS